MSFLLISQSVFYVMKISLGLLNCLLLTYMPMLLNVHIFFLPTTLLPIYNTVFQLCQIYSWFLFDFLHEGLKHLFVKMCFLSSVSCTLILIDKFKFTCSHLLKLYQIQWTLDNIIQSIQGSTQDYKPVLVECRCELW